MRNTLVCDLETGICGEAGSEDMELLDLTKPKKTIDLYYVTDPICSHCWALEPVLKRFVAQFGDYFRFHTVMGGLLEKWDGFADVSNGINGPEDVAGHWREVGEYSRMPIDGTLWLDNPVTSSFIPSRVFKMVQAIDSSLATVFLRRAREAVFAFNQNISDEKVLIDIVNGLGLHGEELVKKAASDEGKKLLNEDFQLAASLGVRGFPTIIMVNEEKKGVKIVGSRPLEYYVKGLQQILGVEELRASEQPRLSELLQGEKLLFSKEIEVMYDVEQQEVAEFISGKLDAANYQTGEVLGETFVEVK